MEKIFPMGVGDFLQYGEEIASFGAWSPLVDAAIAHLWGNGEALMSAKYGRGRVFEPTDSFLTKLTKTLSWVAESYQPGQLREIRRLEETIRSETGPYLHPDREEIAEYRQDMASELGKYLNREPSQFVIRQLGFNTYLIDTLPRDSVSELASDRAIQAEIRLLRESVSRQRRELLGSRQALCRVGWCIMG